MELYEKGKKIGTVEFTTQYDPNPEPPKKNDYGMRLWKGLPSVDGNEIKTDELKKIYELKRIEHENLTIQSRILKLEKEGQKAEKKIVETERQKKFLNQMQDMKRRDEVIKLNHQKESQIVYE